MKVAVVVCFLLACCSISNAVECNMTTGYVDWTIFHQKFPLLPVNNSRYEVICDDGVIMSCTGDDCDINTDKVIWPVFWEKYGLIEGNYHYQVNCERGYVVSYYPTIECDSSIGFVDWKVFTAKYNLGQSDSIDVICTDGQITGYTLISDDGDNDDVSGAGGKTIEWLIIAGLMIVLVCL
jgi:hypothetical protein